MNTVMFEEIRINTPHGNLYAKKWFPEKIDNQTPIVLLHDSLGCTKLWRDFPEILAMKLSRCVISYDRLGFGQSDVSTAVFGLGFIEDEAKTFFPYVKKAFSLNKYVLFGHSVGGGMAINIAASDPDCVGIISESTQAFVEDITLAGIKNAEEAFKNEVQIARLEKWHEGKAKWVLSAWIDTWLSPTFSNWSLSSNIAQVTCPVLVLHGDNDEYGSKAFPEYIANNTGGGSTMLVLQGCGHVPHKEQTHEVIESIIVFLQASKL